MFAGFPKVREVPADHPDVTHDASRRTVLAGGAALTAAIATPVVVASPAAAATYPVNPYTATSVPSATALHYLNRLGCGYSRTTYAQMKAIGSAAKWLDAQLSPSTVTEGPTASALTSWYPDLGESVTTKWSRNTSGDKGGWEYARDLANYSMLRRAYSYRQVLESLVDFWSNHLHVHADHDTAWVWRWSYDALVRKHALGRFEDMLLAASLHPAMLLYLDNWRSVRGAPNENQGRELLELHTVGRSAGYTEAMVKDSAKILSGYTVDAFDTWAFRYDATKHTTGAVQVLGFTHANASTDGRAVTTAYLKYLANHPATALNIARKLCRHYIGDSASTTVVNVVAKAFRDSGTDIKATVRALVAHPEFLASRGTVVRTPVEDFVATVRALRVVATKPTSEDSFANTAVWVPQSTPVYQWPRPDGSPYGDATWSSATRMLSSFRMHWNLTAGWWPTQQVGYRTGASWMPAASLRLDRYVDHLCRTLLGRPSSTRLLNAALTTVGYGPATVVTADHPVNTWLYVRLVGALLDSPDHMRR